MGVVASRADVVIFRGGIRVGHATPDVLLHKHANAALRDIVETPLQSLIS